MEQNTAEINLRMLQNGRYIWTISVSGDSSEFKSLISKLYETDGIMRDTFPDHVTRSSVKVNSISSSSIDKDVEF